ncbi:MAG: glycosyltransferase family 2 protein [Chitinophagaceae bacterium]
MPLCVTKAPLVSIIIPTYNSSKTLLSCLRSITTQDFQNIQVLIMDGKSTDDTTLIAQSVAKDYTFVQYESKPDNGIYDAMNKGAATATGEWLIFMGADDELHDHTVLSRISTILLTTDADFVYGNAELIGDSSWAKHGTIYDGPFPLRKLFKKNICHQAVFYRRHLFTSIGNYNTRFTVCADWDFNFRCFAKGKVQYADQVISKFAGGGYSTNVTVDDFNNESIFLLKKYFDISFFNSLLDPFDWVFYHHFLRCFSRRKYFRAAYYWILAIYHSHKKISMLRVTLGRVKGRLVKTSK